MNYLKKYGKHELERFAYLRIYKGMSTSKMYYQFHRISKVECENLEKWINDHPSYKLWEVKSG